MRHIFYIILFCSFAVAQSYQISGERLFTSAKESVVFIEGYYGMGSGVIIDDTGYVITNYHVIEGSTDEELSCYLYDYRTQSYTDLNDNDAFAVKILYTDKSKDLALLKIISPPNNLDAIEFANPSSLQVGAKVHAIGHPGGEFTDSKLWYYTEGIISRIARETWSYGQESSGLLNLLSNALFGEEESYVVDVLAIFTQTPINEGNSGGLLMNDKGEMVGINTMTEIGMNDIAGAVSINDVNEFINDSNIVLESKNRRKEDKKSNKSVILDFGEIDDPEGSGFGFYRYISDDSAIYFEMIFPMDDDESSYILVDLDDDEYGDAILYDVENDDSYSHWKIDIDSDGYIDWEGDVNDKKKRKHTKFISTIDDLLIDTFLILEDEGFFDDYLEEADSWTKIDQDDFMKSCVEEAIKDTKFSEARRYCNCVLDDLMDDYDNPTDALSADLYLYVLDCL